MKSPILIKTTKQAKRDNKRLTNFRNQSIETLDSLIQPHGIYASSAGLNNGKFHHFFGRDSAITTLLILESERLNKKRRLSKKSLKGLLAIAEFQGQKDNSATGEEFGKIPHEINTDKNNVKQKQLEFVENGEKPWFIDPKDGYLKNWDSVDSTPLWIICIAKYIEYGWEMPADAVEKLADASVWCLSSIERFGGFVGWIPAESQPGRIYGGLTNQAWKDSGTAFMHENGRTAKYPVYDIFSNAATWAALNYASILLKKSHPYIAIESAKVAKSLKRHFNREIGGFRNTKYIFFAEALDAKFNQLQTPSLDVGMCLGVDFRGEIVFNKRFQGAIIKRLVSEEFTDEMVGTRSYTKQIKAYSKKDQYHRGPNTYWPFAAIFTALGMEKQGYKAAASKLINATLNGLSNFDSMVELYQKRDGKVKIWQHPESDQTSTLNQAWTAAGGYYASNYLLRRNKTLMPVANLNTPYVSQLKVFIPAAPIVYDGNLIRFDKKLKKQLKGVKRNLF